MLRFIAHHLWDEAEREKNPEHGMPQEVAETLRAEGRLKSTGPHAPATVRRRLALWSSLHRWRGLEGPFSGPSIRNALRLAIRAADRPRARKSASAITRDILNSLLGTCGRGRAVDLRDRALLLLAFGSGGRRRSEIARLKLDDLEERKSVAADPSAPKGERLPVLAIRLRRTRTPRQKLERACSSSAGPSTPYAPGSPSRNRSRSGVSADRQMGKYRSRRARSTKRQRDDQEPLRRRRARSGGILGAWACVPVISLKPRASACRSPRPCNSLGIVPSSRRRGITMRAK